MKLELLGKHDACFELGNYNALNTVLDFPLFSFDIEKLHTLRLPFRLVIFCRQSVRQCWWKMFYIEGANLSKSRKSQAVLCPL